MTPLYRNMGAQLPARQPYRRIETPTTMWGPPKSRVAQSGVFSRRSTPIQGLSLTTWWFSSGDLIYMLAMVLANKLDRNLRAVEESSDGEDYYEVTDRSSSASVIEADEGGNVISSGGEEDAGSEDRVSIIQNNSQMGHANIDKSDVENDDDQVKAQMSRVSFGALAKAQDVLSKSSDRKRKRGDDTSKSQEDKLEALRERLRQIKAEKLASGAQPSKKAKTSSKSKAKPVQSDSGDDDASDSEGSDSDAAPHARSSKHAPAVQSSKRMVSRKRQVVEVKKPVFRDPRFDNVSGPRPDEYVVDKRYSFLNDYRASEISELRNTIKKTKNEDEKERLKKKLLSMESQQKARENKEKLKEVSREHKKKEKELVKEGKKPFFLKKCMSMIVPPLNGHVLTVHSSRAKEDCVGRPVPEHEIEAARQGHRTPAQESHCQRKEEHARYAAHCLTPFACGAFTHAKALGSIPYTQPSMQRFCVLSNFVLSHIPLALCC